MGVATIERWERAPHQRRKLPKLEHVALNSASETGSGVAIECAECARHTDPRPPRGPQTPHSYIFVYTNKEVGTRHSYSL